MDLAEPAESEIRETLATLTQQHFWTERVEPFEAPILRANTYQAIAEKSGAAVVNIFTSQIIFGKVVSEPLGLLPIRVGVPMPHKGTSLGSGVLVNAEGYILTSREVVLAAQSVEVRLPGDDRAFPAKVVGEAPATDVVLLKIEAPHPLPFLVLGDSDQVRPGEAVVALGNPQGTATPIVSPGVVAQRGKGQIGVETEPAGSEETEILEVYGAIGPANVGGPLLDLQGNVVGINMIPVGRNVVASPASGIGYAIPIQVAKRSVAIFLTRNPLIQMFGK